MIIWPWGWQWQSDGSVLSLSHASPRIPHYVTVFVLIPVHAEGFGNRRFIDRQQVSGGREVGRISIIQASPTRRESHGKTFSILCTKYLLELYLTKEKAVSNFKDLDVLMDVKYLGPCWQWMDAKLALVMIGIICECM